MDRKNTKETNKNTELPNIVIKRGKQEKRKLNPNVFYPKSKKE